MTRAPDFPAPDLPDHPVLADADPTYILQSSVQALMACLRTFDARHVAPVLMQKLAVLHTACADVDAQLQTPMPPPTPMPPGPLDPTVFGRLMSLAGPETARDLLDRLVEDLASVQTLLIAARHGPEWEALRNQSHILIGLAGAVGATDLHDMAQDLNTLSNQMEPHGLAPLLARLIPALDALIQFLHAQRTSDIAAQ
jgi:two-component system, OmpR family, aerobic respiration control sensor histidine kinase ArcB